MVHPSIYSEMVWEARKRRFSRDRGRIDWIVMRNRLGATEARNKRDVGATLEALAKRIGFRTVKGFGERVIFRELYLQGLTLMDVREAGLGIQLAMSHVAARAEVRALIGAIRKPPPRLALTPPGGLMRRGPSSCCWAAGAIPRPAAIGSRRSSVVEQLIRDQ